MKRKHDREHQQIFPSKELASFSDTSLEYSDCSSNDFSTVTSKQSLINFAIAKHLIIRCNMPLCLVENHAFREFVKECGIKWNPISSKKLKSDLISQFVEKVDANIHEILASVSHVTLTVDGWSDRRCRSFLGFTCHTISSKLEPSSFLIDFLRLKSPHTAENIREITENVLDRFNIREKVYKIITDNASSMIKAFTLSLTDEDVPKNQDEQESSVINGSSFDDDDCT